MQNKKIFLLSLILPITFLAVFFVPNAFAAYECTIQYDSNQNLNGNNVSQPAATTEALLNSCCYQAVDEPYSGVSCRPINKFLQKLGGAVVCETSVNLITKAESQQTNNRKTFNCFTGSTPNTCRAGWCPSGGECEKDNGFSCPVGKNRVNICPGGCGSCNQDSVYCPSNVSTDAGTCIGSLECSSAPSCNLKKYGPGITNPNDANSCVNQGKDVANFCTGECTGCSAGYTESGRSQGACIPFAQRFIEIFDDGLTWLGGHIIDIDGDGSADDIDGDGIVEDNAYDYSPTGPTGLSDTYLKSDVAWNLDWSNPDLPPGIKWLLTNLHTCKIDADCDSYGSGMSCSASGLCFTPGYTNYSCNDNSDCTKIDASLLCDTNTNFCYYSGGGSTAKTCSSDSECDWLDGFVCTDAGKCGLPGGISNNYYTCSTDANCSSYGAGYKCSSNGYCYNPNDGDGYPCDSNSDCDWLDGYTCQCDFGGGGECITTGVCKIPTPEADLFSKFVGLTGNTNGNVGGYAATDALCSAAIVGSHVCSSEEMISSYRSKTAALIGITGSAWINNGPPGYILYPNNDCTSIGGTGGAWTEGVSSKVFGPIWNFVREEFKVRTCNSTVPFACCK